MFDENVVRASASITMALGAVAFTWANFYTVFEPIQIVTTFFFVDFLIRVTLGLGYSPVGATARRLTRRLEPQWVSAKPKRFAWTLGLIMSFSMMGDHERGHPWSAAADHLPDLPRVDVVESVFSLFLGCEIYGFLARRGWVEPDEAIEVCVGGACDIAPRLERTRIPTAGS